VGLFDILKKKEESQPVAPPQLKVLVVDDEQYLREFYQDLLAQQGYTVTMATNGQEALTSVAKNKPDLILLDIMMPVIDGNHVLKILWDNPATRTIPVIVLTNAGNIKNMENAEFYSAYKFLIKSNVSPDEVLKVVVEALTNPNKRVAGTMATPQSPTG